MHKFLSNDSFNFNLDVTEDFKLVKLWGQEKGT